MAQHRYRGHRRRDVAEHARRRRHQHRRTATDMVLRGDNEHQMQQDFHPQQEAEQPHPRHTRVHRDGQHSRQRHREKQARQPRQHRTARRVTGKAHKNHDERQHHPPRPPEVRPPRPHAHTLASRPNEAKGIRTPHGSG